MTRLLEVDNLTVEFQTHLRKVYAVRGVSLHLNEGEVLAVVGESGCGKSVTAKSIMRLLPKKSSRIQPGSAIRFKGKDLTAMSERQMAKLRGCEISMVFQDPMTSLNPTMKVGEQIAESLLIHKGVSRREAQRQSVDLIRTVGIPNPELTYDKYPHQLSGGMRQRIVIAIALVCRPKLLIADEPTTALDVTIQAQIIELLKDLKDQLSMAVMLITHDLGVVANFADRIAVMYAGKIVESGTVHDIFYHPKHPYTIGLLQSIPRLDNVRGEALRTISGSPPDLSFSPKGCAFAARCRHVMDICEVHEPVRMDVSRSHHTHCWLMDERAPKAADIELKTAEV